MPRQARIQSKTGFYHVMIRGNEGKEIFVDNEDRQCLINTLIEKAEKERVEVYAYCLMDNHVHLLLAVIENNLARLMKRINVSYASYFNKKYKRTGHLFQDRFGSENIESDAYLLEILRYIHHNPAKAEMVKTPVDYRWSSFHDYVNKDSNSKLKVEKVLGMFSDNKEIAINSFMEFSDKFSEFQFLEHRDKTREEKRESQEQGAQLEFQEMLCKKNLRREDLMSKENVILRNDIIRYLRIRHNLSVRQMEKITGIGRGIVLKQYNKSKNSLRNI